MKTTDTIVVIVIFLITAVAIISLIMHFLPKGNVQTPISNPSELARFIRYMSCSMAACIGGCDSSETYAITLEYGESDQAVLGCNQLLHDENYCTGSNVGERLCDSTKALSFTFKELTTYRGDYDVTLDNPGTCSPLTQSGFQTDVSCIGRWYDDLVNCACLRCMRVGSWVTDVRPEGKLAKHTGGCGRDASKYMYSGTIWIPDTMVTSGICVDTTGLPYFDVDQISFCDFPEDQTIKIWAEDSYHSDYNCFWVIVEGCIGGILAGNPDHSCPQIVICDT